MEKKIKPLELADMIRSLRVELANAQKQGDGEDIKFDVEDVELELQIEANEDIEGSVGAKFFVLTSSYKANKSDAITQRIKLKLKPVGKDGKPVQMSDEDHLVD